jgi:hypothetical protein
MQLLHSSCLLRAVRSRHAVGFFVQLCVITCWLARNAVSVAPAFKTSAHLYILMHVERGARLECMQTRFGPCPRADEVCPYKGCPVVNGNMCSGQGNCFEGKCHCAIDRSGADCSNALCWSDQDCRDGQFCSDTQECTWGTAPPPPPPMNQFDRTQVRPLFIKPLNSSTLLLNPCMPSIACIAVCEMYSRSTEAYHRHLKCQSAPSVCGACAGTGRLQASGGCASWLHAGMRVLQRRQQ